jgi:hypothetical protein
VVATPNATAPSLVVGEAAEELRADEIAAVLDAASHSLRVIRDA